ncbi:MAG: pyridoxal phosphate-dependent aminotransferase [candidate division WOR-3 bacterium]
MISERGKNTPKSSIRKLMHYADKARKEGVYVYHLNIGQPDIKTPKVILNGIRNFDEEILAYSPSQGIPELREAITEYLNEDFSLKINPDEVFITTGGSEGILFTLLAVLNYGEEILTPEPFYSNYGPFVSIAGCKLIPIETSMENGFHLPSSQKIKSLITPKTKAILVCSPNNPTGTLLTDEEMKMLVDIAFENNLWIFSDETYREIVFEGKAPKTFLQFEKAIDRIVVIDSISKKFSACGARIGYVVTKNKELYDILLKFGMARLCAPTVEQYAAIKGFRERKNIIPEIVKEYEHRRNVAFEEIGEIEGVIYRKTEGAFYTIVKLPVENAEEFIIWMLTSFRRDGKTTMITPADGCYTFPSKGINEARIAFVLNEKDLRDALRILREGLYEFNNKYKKIG